MGPSSAWHHMHGMACGVRHHAAAGLQTVCKACMIVCRLYATTLADPACTAGIHEATLHQACVGILCCATKLQHIIYIIL